jgi:hypothetical protein
MSLVVTWKFVRFIKEPRLVKLQNSCSPENLGLAVSSGYSYTGGRDNPGWALQAGLVIRIGLYRQVR